MSRLALAVAAALLLPAPAALAGYSSGYGEHRAKVCGLATIMTDPVPAKASVRIRVFANGSELSGLAISPHAFQWMGRGVAVLGRSQKGTAPLRFRVANLRGSCSRVRITFRWQAG